MSLDIYLTRKRYISYDEGKTYTEDEEQVHWQNITHNLGKMAREAMIYDILWHPEIGIKAEVLIHPIEQGIQMMKDRPKHFKKFDAENGWGTYDVFLPWLEQLLEKCKEFPQAVVEVSI